MSAPLTSPTPISDQAAGIVFVGCEGQAPLAAVAQVQPPKPTQPAARGRASQPSLRREVVVSGKRIRTVDVHAHGSVPEAMALMSAPLAGPPQLLFARVEDRIAAMDAQGIDIEALSINPFWYEAERDVAAPLIKIQNEKLAEFCGAHKERFVSPRSRCSIRTSLSSNSSMV